MAGDRNRSGRGGLIAPGVMIAGGLLAAVAGPGLVKKGRRVTRGIGGMTFVSGAPGGPRPHVDPAAGRAG